MARLPRTILQTPEANLWRAVGCAEFCRRVSSVVRNLDPAVDTKRIPSALGLRPASYYSLLRGVCTYNLFYRHVVPTELQRLRRRESGSPVGDDAVFSDAQWQSLDIVGLARVYAPQLLGISPSDRSSTGSLHPNPGEPRFSPPNQIFEVSQQLLEECLPMMLKLSQGIVQTCLAEVGGERIESKSRSADFILKPAKPISILTQLVNELPFPAGFADGAQSPKILGVNSSLCDLLDVPPDHFDQGSLASLLSLAAERTPKHLQPAIKEALYRKLGERTTFAREREPFCTQFYLDNRGRKNRLNDCYLVTTVAFCLRYLGEFHPVEVVFCYHLRLVDGIP